MTDRAIARVPMLELRKNLDLEAKDDDLSYAQTDRRTQR